MTDEININQETVETSAPEEAAAVVEPQDQDSAPAVDIPLRDQLTRKAARFLDESDYTEDEYADMLSMYDSTMKSFELGNIVEGKILNVTDDSVIVDIGFKSEGVIPIQEFGDKAELQEGDEVEVEVRFTAQNIPDRTAYKVSGVVHLIRYLPGEFKQV